MTINQLRKSIVSTVKILEGVEKARINYGEDSNVFQQAMAKLKDKQARHDFVVKYYNELQLIRSRENPILKNHPKEKELRETLLFMEANRIYQEKYNQKNWLGQARRKKIDEEFLNYFLITDRFTNLVLQTYEKLDQDIKNTQKFLEEALNDPDPLNFILRELTEHIQLATVKKYKVKPGDTLTKLFGKRWKIVAKYNGITDPTKLMPNQVIIDPKTTINIPKDVDKVIQIAFEAAQQIVKSELEQFVLVKYTVAIARIESREGRNIGTGNFLKDMNPNEWQAFLEVCLKLDLIPEETPVSEKPYYGWGGAMGPGQSLPRTWLATETDVAVLTLEKFVSPFNLKHGIYGIALRLVGAGIVSGNGEFAEKRAVMRYLAGTRWDEKQYEWYWKQVKKEALELVSELIEIQRKIAEEKKN